MANKTIPDLDASAALTAATTFPVSVDDAAAATKATGTKVGALIGFLSGLATSVINLLTGANIASAGTINLDTATGNRVHITGTTTITAVTLTRGPRTLIFDGILTLTHHATTNNLPGAANITTAAGDRAIYESDGTTVYCVAYIRATAAPLAAYGTGVATALGVNVGSAGAFVTFNGALGTPSSGALTNTTADGTNPTGYKNIPGIADQSGSYTLLVTDVGKYVPVTAGGSITIPDATFAKGDVISLFNNTSSTATITCSITTAYIAGTDADEASITLAARGLATILFHSGTVCVVSGNVS